MFWRFHSALEAASSEKVIDDGWRVLRVTCRRSMNRDGCRLSLQPRLSDAESPRLSPLVSSVTTHLHEHCPGEAPGWRGAGTDLRWPPDTVRLYDLVRRNLTLMIDCRHHYFTTVQDDNAHRDSITALTTATQFLGAVFFRCSFFVQKNDRRWLRSSTMETCILIPPELSVMLRPTGRRGRLLEMEATLWTNCALRSGFTLLPDDGELRLDRLELFADLSDKDVRTTLHDSP